LEGNANNSKLLWKKKKGDPPPYLVRKCWRKGEKGQLILDGVKRATPLTEEGTPIPAFRKKREPPRNLGPSGREIGKSIFYKTWCGRNS